MHVQFEFKGNILYNKSIITIGYYLIFGDERPIHLRGMTNNGFTSTLYFYESRRT